MNKYIQNIPNQNVNFKVASIFRKFFFSFFIIFYKVNFVLLLLLKTCIWIMKKFYSSTSQDLFNDSLFFFFCDQ